MTAPTVRHRVVRAAHLDDAAGIAHVHVSAWREAYRGLLSDQGLATLDVEQRTVRWREILTRAQSTTLVVPSDQGVEGFCSVGPSRDHDTKGQVEIYALYALPAAWGTGAGHALYREATRHAAAIAMPLSLWVLEGNVRGRSFYERQGMSWDGAKRTDEVLGTRVEVLRYALTPR